MGEHHRFRIFFAWQFEKEERWINALSEKKGWQLQRVGCCHYVFEEGVRGEYIYRLELLRRTMADEAEKQYLKTSGAVEICRNGEWGYYRRKRSEGPFSAYTCSDSKLAYLRPVYRHFIAFGIAVYLALAMDMYAFLGMPMTLLHGAVLGALFLIAFGFTCSLTFFSRLLKRLQRRAQEESGQL